LFAVPFFISISPKGHAIMAKKKKSFDISVNRSNIVSALIFLTVLFLFCAFSPALFAADENKPEKKSTTTAKPNEKTFEDITLSTADNLQLAISYYRGAKGRESVPVVLLHGYGAKHNRTDYTKGLAPYLQAQGFAVIAVDLRGHGESTRIKTTRGKDEILDSAGLAPNQFGLMVTQDMKAVKNFLWERNNAGELNIDKLCLVGAEMGASIALEFALFDAIEQDVNPVLRPEYKLGRFVKALVLISPETSFRGISIRRAVQNPAVRNDISILILVGKGDSKALNESKRVHAIFEREHPKPDPEKKAEQQTLFFTPLETTLQGTNLLAEKNLKADDIIAAFLDLRLVKSEPSKTWSWKERKLPHQ
jgi:dienelactone hydrolase